MTANGASFACAAVPVTTPSGVCSGNNVLQWNGSSYQCVALSSIGTCYVTQDLTGYPLYPGPVTLQNEQLYTDNCTDGHADAGTELMQCVNGTLQQVAGCTAGYPGGL